IPKAGRPADGRDRRAPRSTAPRLPKAARHTKPKVKFASSQSDFTRGSPSAQSVIRTRPMRYIALILALLLAGCGRQSFHMTDISGAMPRLDSHLTRASEGAAVTGESYRGKIVLLYFGYTNCPDVCPATLANIAGMLAKLHSKDVQVLFVTVDPNR